MRSALALIDVQMVYQRHHLREFRLARISQMCIRATLLKLFSADVSDLAVCRNARRCVHRCVLVVGEHKQWPVTLKPN